MKSDASSRLDSRVTALENSSGGMAWEEIFTENVNISISTKQSYTQYRTIVLTQSNINKIFNKTYSIVRVTIYCTGKSPSSFSSNLYFGSDTYVSIGNSISINSYSLDTIGIPSFKYSNDTISEYKLTLGGGGKDTSGMSIAKDSTTLRCSSDSISGSLSCSFPQNTQAGAYVAFRISFYGVVIN